MQCYVFVMVCLTFEFYLIVQTVENVACILRNLSYRLENEIDPQEGADDVLDREWEMEQRREIEELDRSFAKAAPGCFAFLTRPRRRDNTLRINTPAALNRPMYNIDFANPGQWVCVVGSKDL